MEEGNDLSDSLDPARILLLDRNSLAMRLHHPNTIVGMCRIANLLDSSDTEYLANLTLPDIWYLAGYLVRHYPARYWIVALSQN